MTEIVLYTALPGVVLAVVFIFLGNLLYAAGKGQ